MQLESGFSALIIMNIKYEIEIDLNKLCKRKDFWSYFDSS